MQFGSKKTLNTCNLLDDSSNCFIRMDKPILKVRKIENEIMVSHVVY